MKTLICFSGGLDSTVLAAMNRHKGNDVTLGIFKTDNKSYLDDDFIIINQVISKVHTSTGALSTYNKVLFNFMESDQMKTTLSKKDEKVNQLESCGALEFFVGYKWNMISTLLSYGSSHGYDTVELGNNLYNIHYKDEDFEYVCKMRDLFAEIYDRVKVPQIKYPFKDLNKSDIVELNDKYKYVLNIQETYSCAYSNTCDGEYVHCGECDFCLDRKKAFLNAGVMDYTYYIR